MERSRYPSLKNGWKAAFQTEKRKSEQEAAPTGAAFSFSETSSRFFPTLFHINPQKSLILDEQGSIIILYYCIYLKVRAKNGFKYRTLVLHERNL